MRRAVIAVYCYLCFVLIACAPSVKRVATDPSLVAKAVQMEPSALDSVGNLTLIIELTGRGLTEWGCPERRDIVATWRPPTDGSPATHYVFQLWALCDSVPDTTLTFSVPPWFQVGDLYLEAVTAGVDADGDQGPYSEPGYVTLEVPE